MRAFLVVRHDDRAVVESLLCFPPLRPWLSSPSQGLHLLEDDALGLLVELEEEFLDIGWRLALPPAPSSVASSTSR